MSNDLEYCMYALDEKCEHEMNEYSRVDECVYELWGPDFREIILS